MAQWLSPVDALLRSGVRASEAMQHGLDRIASSHPVSALNPFAWIRLTADVFVAAFVSRASGASAVSTEKKTRTPPHTPGAPIPVPAPTAAPVAVPAPPAIRPQVLQAILDQDALLQIFCVPERPVQNAAIAGGAGTAGFEINGALHRFDVDASPPSNCTPVTAVNTLGERVGTYTGQWMFKAPVASKGSAEQNRLTIAGRIQFGAGTDAFNATGSGATSPVTVRGRKQLAFTAAATVSEGSGKFKDYSDGIVTFCGLLDSARGFRGVIALRVADRTGALLTTDPLPALQVRHYPEQRVTWLTIRAQASPSSKVAPLDGQTGIILQQDAQLVDIDCALRSAKGLACSIAVRPAIGRVASRMAFDRRTAGGTPDDPLSFSVWREFSFFDSIGNPIGGFTAEASEGMALIEDVAEADGVRPAVKGIRFAGAGRILAGSGQFEGMRGMIAENTFITTEPYAGSSLYVLRVEDPWGRFTARSGVWRDIPVDETASRAQ